jgi:hypothetical protein
MVAFLVTRVRVDPAGEALLAACPKRRNISEALFGPSALTPRDAMGDKW